MIILENAQEQLLSIVNAAKSEYRPIDKCFNRILAEDVYATCDFPPFDRSPLDGYAVRSADVKSANENAPVTLQVIDNIPAGSVSIKSLAPGTAMRIMTGAPIPSGADGVIRLEDTETYDDQVVIRTGANAAKNICAQGEEITNTEKVLTRGTRINSSSVGLLAMFGITTPLVYERPKIGILSTGSEIVRMNEPLTPGKIRDTNSQMLMMEVLEAGGVPIMLGRVPDDTDCLIKALQSGGNCDLIITTGGASVGDHDLIEKVYQTIGAEPLFSRVAIKPGMPVLAGKWGDRLLIGLSGNPAAASVSYKLIVRPVLKKMSGNNEIWYPRAQATLNEVFLKTSPVRRFVWGKYSYEKTGITVTPLFHQGNGMLRSCPGSNCLIEIPPDNPPLRPGANVEILILE